MKFRQFFQDATGQKPFPFQEKFATEDLLPHILEVPTGAGKTATVVLGWLWRRRHAPAAVQRATGRRLIFCLPMRSLVDQTINVCHGWLSKLKLEKEVEIHTLMGGSIARDWDGDPDRDMILVGTQDQLLSRALNRGYAMSRYRWPIHFGWLNNDCLWAVDEVQLMGSGLSTTAQLHALRSKFQTLGPHHTLWISATLPPGCLDTVDLRGTTPRRLDLAPADKIVLSDRLNARKPLAPFTGDAKALLAMHEPGTLTLVVVNRVKRAQTWADDLRKHAKGSVPIALIHSRFRRNERSGIQAEILAGKWTGILVATQAIEAGVDISARLMVTELASWTSLVQRFGRCNRYGEIKAGARVFWIDLADSKKDEALPYTVEDLQLARARLASLTDVGPETLSTIVLDQVSPALPVLRRVDLLSLFDTQADLAGHDIDVSGFVRSTETDRDVQVYWRTWADSVPSPEITSPHPDELCRVPVHELEKLLGKTGVVWRWSSLQAKWLPTRSNELFPGMTILLPTSAGGYSDGLGWTGNANHVPTEVQRSDTERLDEDAGDPRTFASHAYVSLEVHSDDVVQEVENLRESLAFDGVPWDTLVRAARWHDLGKAHAVFQTMLTKNLPEGDSHRGKVWAKSDRRGSGKGDRPYFRHELASALAMLEQGGSDLEVFLVAAHHGKVRLAIRPRPTETPPKGDPTVLFALGVYHHDPLPETELGGGVVSRGLELDLTPMMLGRHDGKPSWSERCLGLLEELGPFRLAYLESLVRIADWRGTRKREREQEMTNA